MAKKKQIEDDHKGNQINFRTYDPRLVDAIQIFADRTCYGNRTMAMNRLIEDALTRINLWPPQAD